ncbi:unnamed protein product [Bemisia tabaci]|uniref:Protein RFT1 homolog n=1 Tax=Bemisia tabaci TaxID=7038 RepID=A0A9P0ADY6_BEMTA|nr:unnamed protein product [Bemisia tabaci]
MSRKRNFLKSSLEDASFNIILQILFRAVTFFLNAFVLRHVSQDVIGVMNVRLLLLESTLLFLSREAFRRACLTKTLDHHWPQVINLLWLTVPICSVLSVVFGYIWLHYLTPPDPSITEHYYIGVWAMALSCILEMTVEPLYLVSQAFLFVRLRVVLESLIVGVRTVTFTCIVLRSPKGAIIAFSAAQMLSITSYVVCFYSYFNYYTKQRRKTLASIDDASKLARRQSIEDEFPFTSIKDFLPSFEGFGTEPLVDWKLARLTMSFMKQGILKQILTEGERYVMTLCSILSFNEQGVFDVVNNLGSLAARFLFRPIENSAYFYFSQLVSRDTSIKDQNKQSMIEAATVLEQILHCVMSLGVIVLCFGQAYSRLLLFLYGGSTFAQGVGPLLLRSHCMAILFLAINGITECYASATMSPTEIDKFNHKMIYLSIMFLFFSWLFTKLLGSVGFILANCCNMMFRILHSTNFIKKRYKETSFRPLKGLVPGKLFFISSISSCVLTLISEHFFYDDSKLIHLMIGGVCFLCTLGAWVYEEKDLVQLAFHKYQKLRKKTE